MSPPLDKGLACLNCRRRKVRCDGIKPQCGPCGASRAYQDCEFTDSGPTRTQQLQAQISALESRIKEIERPLDVERQQEAVITPSVRAALLQRFLKSTCTTWFFLNIDRFSSAFLDLHGGALNIALTNAVILWGIHLSSSHHAEDLYLSRAVQSASHGLVDSEPYLVQLIQAEVLLALYFFKNARMMEGRYHISLALSMVFGAGFHKIGSRGQAKIAPPKDAVEEGERVSAFWTVVALNNCWTTRESNVSYEDVDTPWPLEMLNLVPVQYVTSSRRTVANWLRGEQDSSSNSPLAQLAKASILYEQTIQNGLRCRGNPAQFLHNFGRLRSRISQLLLGPQTAPVLVQVLLYSATLQLYLPVVDINPDATASIMTAIRSICRLLPKVQDVSDLDPFLSTLLASACRFLITHEPRSTNPEVVDMLRVIVDVMTEMAKFSRHAEMQIREIQQLLM